MEGYFEVTLNGEGAGKVEVCPQGLYCLFRCRCRFPAGKIYRLAARWADHWENLGIPVPAGDGFYLEKKLPRKRLGEGKPEFLLIEKDRDLELEFAPREEPAAKTQQEEPRELPRQEEAQEHQQEEPQPQPLAQAPEEPLPAQEQGQFYPVEEEQPFEAMEQLEQAGFLLLGEQPGLILPRESEQNQSESSNPTGQWSEPSTEE